MSLWANGWCQWNEVAARAGHTSVSVVLDRYRHLFTAEIERTTGRLEAMFDAGLVREAEVISLQVRHGR